MMTGEFAEGIERLLSIADGPTDPSLRSPAATSLVATSQEGSGGTAIMCAERVYFHCHRMLVSDYLTAQGHTVLHIDDEEKPPRTHTLMAEARLVDGKLTYDNGILL